MEQNRLIPGWLKGAIAVVTLSAFLVFSKAPNGAQASLKTLSSADADFRANDRTWNYVNDFWTSNVAGLYSMTSARLSSGFFGEVVDKMNRCREHFENPACSHSLKEWAQLPCSLRCYYSTMD